MRGVRLEIDYFKPESLLEEHGVRETIVVFGSTRICEPAAACRNRNTLQAALAADPALTAAGIDVHPGLFRPASFIEAAVHNVNSSLILGGVLVSIVLFVFLFNVRTGFISLLAEEMRRRPWTWIALAPEGTRAHTDHWKSGFYHLALAARAPVGLAFIDYGARVVGLHTYIELTGDEAADVARIRLAYAGKVGRHPELASEIRLQPGPDRAR